MQEWVFIKLALRSRNVILVFYCNPSWQFFLPKKFPPVTVMNGNQSFFNHGQRKLINYIIIGIYLVLLRILMNIM